MLQKPQEAADVAVLEAYQCDDFKDRLAGLGVAQEFYEKDKANLFSARATEEEMLLLKIEREQELKTGEAGLVDLSVTQLMERYIVKGDVSRTQQAHATAIAHGVLQSDQLRRERPAALRGVAHSRAALLSPLSFRCFPVPLRRACAPVS